MKLNRNKIFEIVSRIKMGETSNEELIEALGGKKLYEIFDENTIEGILRNIIDNGRLHKLMKEIDGDGLGVLEGLLNKRIIGDLSDFYIIKSDYILNLTPEERKNMAQCICGSGDQKELVGVLQVLWDKGIATEACTTRKNNNEQMIQLKIKANDLETQQMIQQIYQCKDISADVFYYSGDETFDVRVYGDNLYDYILGNIGLSISDKKDNIFEEAIKNELELLTEMYDSYLRDDIDTTKVNINILKTRRKLIELRKQNEAMQANTDMEGQIHEKKTWELDPKDEEKIQRQCVEIGRRYRNSQIHNVNQQKHNDLEEIQQ